MAQYIKQGNIFGRIGSGIGKGLAEQLPQEIERGRLSSGLQAFEKDYKNLEPMQQIARLAAIPGMTPQTIQSMTELAKYNNKANAYRRSGENQGQQGQNPQQGQQNYRSSPDLLEVNQSKLMDKAGNFDMPNQSRINVNQGPGVQQGNKSGVQGRNPPVVKEGTLQDPNATPLGNNQVANVNAGDTRSLPAVRWSPAQRDARVNEYTNKGFQIDQAEQLAKDDEARELGQAEDLNKRQKEKTSRNAQAEQRLDEFLGLRLEKTGPGIYKDITGDMLVDLKRAMTNELIEHPEKSTDDVAAEFSKRALNLAQAKTEVRGLAARSGIENLLPGTRLLNKLRNTQKIFADAGNQEEYFNILRKDFGASPQGAAVVAFPAKPPVNKYISEYKPDNIRWGRFGPIPDKEKIINNAKKAALDISKILDEDDSVLGIARMLSEKDPSFDQRAFFEELSENPSIRLNARQKKEVGPLGERDTTPTWGDIKIFPSLGRSTK